jgi:hypothetical protein
VHKQACTRHSAGQRRDWAYYGKINWNHRDNSKPAMRVGRKANRRNHEQNAIFL